MKKIIILSATIITFTIIITTIICCIFFNSNVKQIEKPNIPDIKIIATLGKDGDKKITKFYHTGARIFRINGSHIKNEDMLINTIQKAQENINGLQDAVLLYDTQGPEIRTIIPNEKTNNKKYNNYSFNVKIGQKIIFHTNLTDKELFKKNKDIHIGVNYVDFINDIQKDQFLTIESGKVIAQVLNIDKEKGLVIVKITQIKTDDIFFTIKDRQHINLYGSKVSLPTLTDNDKKYIKLSLQNGVKYLAISFVRTSQDIKDVKNIIEDTFKNDKYKNEKIKNIKIIAKFETKQGIQNIDEIMKIADGAMIARGDLLCEIPFEKVPYAKIKIIESCKKNGNKMCILATDVLESLLRQNIVSRNDADVIATSLIQGVNSLMLSNETTQSKNDVLSIQTYDQYIKLFKRKILKKYYKDVFLELQTHIKHNAKQKNNEFYSFKIKHCKKDIELLLTGAFDNEPETIKKIFYIEGNYLYINPYNIMSYIDIKTNKINKRNYEKHDVKYMDKYFKLLSFDKEKKHNLYKIIKDVIKPKNELKILEKYSNI